MDEQQLVAQLNKASSQDEVRRILNGIAPSDSIWRKLNNQALQWVALVLKEIADAAAATAARAAAAVAVLGEGPENRALPVAAAKELTRISLENWRKKKRDGNEVEPSNHNEQKL